MTTTFANPVIGGSVPTASISAPGTSETGVSASGVPTSGVSADPAVDDLATLRGQLEQQSARRDNWTVMMFGVAIVALLFSLMAVGFGARAMGDAHHNAQVTTSASASGSGSAAAGARQAQVTLSSVALTDMKVTPSATTIAAGTYTVTITNNGMMAHELLVFHTDIAAADLPIGSDGKVAEDAPGFKVSDGDNLDPGASQTRVLDLTQPGTYLFVCNLPGHIQMGMHTTVIVK